MLTASSRIGPNIRIISVFRDNFIKLKISFCFKFGVCYSTIKAFIVLSLSPSHHLFNSPFIRRPAHSLSLSLFPCMACPWKIKWDGPDLFSRSPAKSPNVHRRRSTRRNCRPEWRSCLPPPTVIHRFSFASFKHLLVSVMLSYCHSTTRSGYR